MRNVNKEQTNNEMEYQAAIHAGINAVKEDTIRQDSELLDYQVKKL